MQSRVSRQALSFNVDRAKKPQHADTAKMLNIAEPTIVPILMSPSVINVPTQLTHNSGDDVAIVMNVADANSCLILNSMREEKEEREREEEDSFLICKEINECVYVCMFPYVSIYFDKRCE